MEKIGSVRVILFGVGGVGSWCAEGLVRSGIRHLTIVDGDRISISNLNRQLMATTETVGQSKVEVLKRRLLTINPAAQIEAIEETYSDQNYQRFNLSDYDYIVDAIDSLKDKISLILRATDTDAIFYSSMGAALKVDPTRIRVAEFWEVRGCPFGSMLRKRIRQGKILPKKKFLCVYDDEQLQNRRIETPSAADTAMTYNKAVTNGATAHITAIFGFTLCGLLIQDIYKSTNE